MQRVRPVLKGSQEQLSFLNVPPGLVYVVNAKVVRLTEGGMAEVGWISGGKVVNQDNQLVGYDMSLAITDANYSPRGSMIGGTVYKDSRFGRTHFGEVVGRDLCLGRNKKRVGRILPDIDPKHSPGYRWACGVAGSHGGWLYAREAEEKLTKAAGAALLLLFAD